MGGKIRNVAMQPRFAAMLQKKLRVFLLTVFPYFRQTRRQQQQQRQKTIIFMSQTALSARASCLLVHFFNVPCTTST